ncbi:MAG TPA: EF-hand domain-containing protein [Acidobacteriota bacterium]|jgi:Ca2+-binding EF-hand superfamily protein
MNRQTLFPAALTSAVLILLCLLTGRAAGGVGGEGRFSLEVSPGSASAQEERSSQSRAGSPSTANSEQKKTETGRPISPEREEMRRRFALQVFRVLDANRDSAIDLQEFHQIGPKRLFMRMDADQNGKLSHAEWSEPAGGAGMALQQLRRYRAFFLADRDADGRVARNEFFRGAFDDFDEDHDGYLSLNEWKSMESAERNRQISEFIRKNDRNGDGKVTRSEFEGRAEDFDRMDTDMDAEVSSADIVKGSEG